MAQRTVAEDAKAVQQQVIEQARQEFQVRRDSLSTLRGEVSQEALGRWACLGDYGGDRGVLRQHELRVRGGAGRHYRGA